MVPSTYERYPIWIVIVSTALDLAICVLSAVLLARVHLVLAAAYLLGWGWSQTRALRESCVHCAYYGEVCAFGRGLLCAMLLPPGEPSEFAAREITWRDLLPDLALTIVPILGGIIGLVMAFRLWALVALLLLVGLLMIGNGVVRGKLACAHCKQRELGCPAQKLIQPRDGSG